jgi:hypothetical protein
MQECQLINVSNSSGVVKGQWNQCGYIGNTYMDHSAALFFVS